MPSKPKPKRPGQPKLGKAKRIQITCSISPEAFAHLSMLEKQYKSRGRAMDALILSDLV